MRLKTSRPGTVMPTPATTAATSRSSATEAPPRVWVLGLNKKTTETSNPLLVSDAALNQGITAPNAIRAAPTSGLENEKSSAATLATRGSIALYVPEAGMATVGGVTGTAAAGALGTAA